MYPIYTLLYECLGATSHASAEKLLADKCCADSKNENKARKFAEAIFSNPLLQEPQIARLGNILNISSEVLQRAAKDTYKLVQEEERASHFHKVGPHVKVSFANGPQSFSQALLFDSLKLISFPENFDQKDLQEQLRFVKQAIAQYCIDKKQYFSLFDRVTAFTYWYGVENKYVFKAEDFNVEVDGIEK